jgi:hypothetical protein
MARVLYFDCFSGISGDMALGALLDAGLSLDALRTELSKLPVDGWSIDATREMRGYLSGTRALVDAPEQHVHRHLADVREIIDRSSLSEAVKQRSIHIFSLLAQAEGTIHGISANEVHFHEVGALDAIVDIVGVVAGLALMGVEAIYASPLPLGTGWTTAAHGALPIPAPATLSLLAAAKAPIVPDETPFELVTPTGAALLAGLATFRRPAMRVTAVGYGLGKRDLERPNALRVWVGETNDQQPTTDHKQLSADHSSQGESGQELKIENRESAEIVLLETNIDDQPAEQLAYVAERLIAMGALDVWQIPIQMKKGRLATLFSALIPAELEEQAVATLLHETTTLGIRRRTVERHICERAITTVDTPLGPVRVKRKMWQNQEIQAAPEYEDCARLARQHNIPLRDIYMHALQQFRADRSMID